jgi:hypothetical protein
VAESKPFETVCYWTSAHRCRCCHHVRIPGRRRVGVAGRCRARRGDWHQLLHRRCLVFLAFRDATGRTSSPPARSVVTVGVANFQAVLEPLVFGERLPPGLQGTPRRPPYARTERFDYPRSRCLGVPRVECRGDRQTGDHDRPLPAHDGSKAMRQDRGRRFLVPKVRVNWIIRQLRLTPAPLRKIRAPAISTRRRQRAQ